MTMILVMSMPAMAADKSQVDWLPENNIVLCYPKGAEKPELSAVIEHITGQAPVQPSLKEVTDLTGKGEPITGETWAKYMRSDDKIIWLTYQEFNSNVYQLDDMKTYGGE